MTTVRLLMCLTKWNVSLCHVWFTLKVKCCVTMCSSWAVLYESFVWDCLIQAVSVRNNIVFMSALSPAHSDNGHLKVLWNADHWAQSTFDSQGFPAHAMNSLPETLATFTVNSAGVGHYDRTWGKAETCPFNIQAMNHLPLTELLLSQ